MRQISALELDRYLHSRADTPGTIGLLDVRETWEHALCSISGSVLMPMSRIGDHLNELDPERDWVVICHHGVRSLQVGFYLERAGFQSIANLRGGIDAWAIDVDPEMPRY
ncbi:MAG: rhodanese-like domain-containing protein [Betaproteobacteria bacterium]